MLHKSTVRCTRRGPPRIRSFANDAVAEACLGLLLDTETSALSMHIAKDRLSDYHREALQSMEGGRPDNGTLLHAMRLPYQRCRRQFFSLDGAGLQLSRLEGQSRAR